MKRFRKVYLEISNICNLSCSFCPGTKRIPRRMNIDEFTYLLRKLQPWTDYLYFNLMGEPLCHPQLAQFLKIAHEMSFKVILTTNGTLLKKLQDVLLDAPALHKINISLHAFEANDLTTPFSEYLNNCLQFGKDVEGNFIVSYRLWNNGGLDAFNQQILDTMRTYYPNQWKHERHGTSIGTRVYLEHGDKFDWPDLSATESDEALFCYGLRDQIGVLCDGTVVPCCLDHEGDIPLGNLFSQNLDEILNTKRAESLLRGFSCRKAAEPLCRRCGYARRFK